MYITEAEMSSIVGPFWASDEHLVVADFNMRNVYQLKPDSGEVRALTLSPCRPVSLTFDPTINGLYISCVEKIQSSGSKYHYRIRKRTFDGKINQAIYNAPLGKDCRNIISTLLSKYYHFMNKK